MANGDSGSQGFPGVRQLLAQIAMQKLRERSPLFQLQLEQGREALLTSQQGRDAAAAEGERAELLFPGQLQQQKQATLTGDIELEGFKERADAATTTASAGAISAVSQATLDEAQAKNADQLAKLELEQADADLQKTIAETRTFEQDLQLKMAPTQHFSFSSRSEEEGATSPEGIPVIAENARQADMEVLLQLIQQSGVLKDPDGFFGSAGPIDIEDIDEMIRTNDPKLQDPQVQLIMPYIQALSTLRSRKDIAARTSNAPEPFKAETAKALKDAGSLTTFSPEQRKDYINFVTVLGVRAGQAIDIVNGETIPPEQLPNVIRLRDSSGNSIFNDARINDYSRLITEGGFRSIDAIKILLNEIRAENAPKEGESPAPANPSSKPTGKKKSRFQQFIDASKATLGAGLNLNGGAG